MKEGTFVKFKKNGKILVGKIKEIHFFDKEKTMGMLWVSINYNTRYMQVPPGTATIITEAEYLAHTL